MRGRGGGEPGADTGQGAAALRALGGRLDTPNPLVFLFQGLLTLLSTGRTASCLPRELEMAMGMDTQG